MNEKNTTCPYCKEEIKSSAIKCKHCHSSIKPEKPEHHGICPFCKEEIKIDAKKCKHCKSKLDVMIEEKKSCSCSTQDINSRLMKKQDYGQGCFYDCMDGHRGHGDNMNDSRVHNHCESRCGISMPRMFFSNRFF